MALEIDPPNIPGRALTPQQKRDVVERLLVAWQRYPSMRLGQLIENARKAQSHESPLFCLEDEDLMAVMEEFGRLSQDKSGE